MGGQVEDRLPGGARTNIGQRRLRSEESWPGTARVRRAAQPTTAQSGGDDYDAILAPEPEFLRSAPIVLDGLAERDWPAYKR